MITLATTNVLGWTIILAGIVIVSIVGAAVRERDLDNQHNRRSGRSNNLGGAAA